MTPKFRFPRFPNSFQAIPCTLSLSLQRIQHGPELSNWFWLWWSMKTIERSVYKVKKFNVWYVRMLELVCPRLWQTTVLHTLCAVIIRARKYLRKAVRQAKSICRHVPWQTNSQQNVKKYYSSVKCLVSSLPCKATRIANATKILLCKIPKVTTC